jgi:hypothetical protein
MLPTTAVLAAAAAARTSLKVASAVTTPHAPCTQHSPQLLHNGETQLRLTCDAINHEQLLGQGRHHGCACIGELKAAALQAHMQRRQCTRAGHAGRRTAHADGQRGATCGSRHRSTTCVQHRSPSAAYPNQLRCCTVSCSRCLYIDQCTRTVSLRCTIT